MKLENNDLSDLSNPVDFPVMLHFCQIQMHSTTIYLNEQSTQIIKKFLRHDRAFTAEIMGNKLLPNVVRVEQRRFFSGQKLKA